MTRRTRILLSAFACEPGKGSERGNGWLWAEYLSRDHDVTVLTDRRNRDSIEPIVHELDRPSLRIEYVGSGLPRRSKLRRWLYFYRWQWAALQTARQLHDMARFDVAHHVTFGSHRLPSLLWRLDIPFIWGPVGGGEGVAARFYAPRWMGCRESLAELTRSVSNLVVHVDPLQRATARNAAVFGVTTVQTQRAFPASTHAKALVLPSTIVDRDTVQRLASTDPTAGPRTGLAVMYVGRLVGWKGPWLAIRAFADHASTHPDAVLDVYGSGRMRPELEALVRRLDMQDRIRLHGRLARDRLLDEYGRHQVMLFPSLHDSSGFVTIEAQAAGLPVVCLDVGGPGQQVHDEAGVKVRPRTPRQAIAELSAGLTALTNDPDRWRAASRAARRHALDPASTPTIGGVARSLYEKAGVPLVDQSGRPHT